MIGSDATPPPARLVRPLAAPPAIHVLIAPVPTGFLFLGALRSQLFVDDFPTYDRRDDWYAYRVYAESALHDGWTMPAIMVYLVQSAWSASPSARDRSARGRRALCAVIFDTERVRGSIPCSPRTRPSIVRVVWDDLR
jgi:hypothetical protein